VIGVLRPCNGDLTVEDADERSYALTGGKIYFYTACWAPGGPMAGGEPQPSARPAASLHRWDLNTGIPAGTPHRNLCLTVGGAAVALARHCGGVAIDRYGFPFNWPEDLLPA
jgi:hypothetical protein